MGLCRVASDVEIFVLEFIAMHEVGTFGLMMFCIKIINFWKITVLEIFNFEHLFSLNYKYSSQDFLKGEAKN